jgi:hypothetical protein
LITLHLNLDLDFEKHNEELIEIVIDNLKWHLEVEKEIENIEDYKIRR